MSTITDLNPSDTGAASRVVINTNFDNLNTDKIETSVLDTDGTLAADSDAKVATQKATKTYVDANTPSIETTTGVTHSLTTDGSQKVIVWAKGDFTDTSNQSVVTLAYNSVSKDTVTLRLASSSYYLPFSLMYTETPAAGTQNITVTANYGTLANVKIIVQLIS